MKATHLEIRNHLGCVYVCQGFDCFEFNNDGVADQQTQTPLSDRTFLVRQFHGWLSNERNAAIGQLYAQCFLVHGLQQTGTQHTVHLDRSANGFPRQPILLC